MLFKEWLNNNVTESHIQTFLENYENKISEIEKLLNERKSLTEKITPTNWFYFFFLMSSVVFVWSLTLLFGISKGYGITDLGLTTAYFLSIIGLIPILIFSSKIGSLLKELR